MGYYTTYSLSMSGNPEQILAVLGENPNVASYNEPLANMFRDTCKWYDHEEDMMMISRRYPEVRFTLHGDGEDEDDIWIKTFVNGEKKFYPATIVVKYPGYRRPRTPVVDALTSWWTIESSESEVAAIEKIRAHLGAL